MAFDEMTMTRPTSTEMVNQGAMPSGMREALGDVQANGEQIVTLASEYSALLENLLASEFVQQMRRLSQSVIND